MKSISVLAVIISLSFFTNTSSFGAEMETVEIQTSALCYTCQENLEKTFAFTKGVKDFDLDVKTGLVKVTYNPKKTDPAQIRMAIAKTGYDADDVKADPKAFDKLDDCCKLERDLVNQNKHNKN